MPMYKVQQAGAIGVVKDLSAPDMPPNAWTDANNIRFLDGMALQFFGHSEVYATPPQTPQHVLPANVSGSRYWIYATAGKQYAVTNNAGTVTHTDISHVTPRTGVANNWTSTSLSGIPILNAGDGTAPMSWDLNLANKFVDLANWPAATSCRAIRAYKNYLVALNITRPQFFAIASITNSTTTATLTTVADHGLTTGTQVVVSGVTPSQYNGTYTITVTGAKTFTYVMASAPAGSATVLGSLRTVATANYPFMVKWSQPADPGTVPNSWDYTDPTKDAGELDIAEGQDPIVDGLQLRDSFMIYKESSIWRMDYTGGPFVFRLQKVLGSSGALNRNCIVEVDGTHVVLTNQDVIVHDGQTATSVLDKQTRRFLFQQIDTSNSSKAFVFKNTFFNEVFICYPSLGSSVCDKAMVWNYKDKTVTFRDLPSLNHAAFGPVDEATSSTWSGDTEVWAADLSVWDGGGLVPQVARVIMASNNGKLYLLDGSAYSDGVAVSSYLERRGLTFEIPENIKTVKGIRPRIKGTNGDTVVIKVGSADDPNVDPVYQTTMTHTIGTTVVNDCFVSGRYIGIRFESGTAAQFRLESFDVDVVGSGMF